MDGHQDQAIPVVGIGASAGGIEALGNFFDAMPADSGCAFVVVLHLDPKHEGEMVKVLSSHTKMPVVQIKDSTKTAPNRVYVIAPYVQHDYVTMPAETEPLAPTGEATIEQVLDDLRANPEEATAVVSDLMINQIEVHPYFQQAAVQRKNAELGILTQAWSPIGGITFYCGSGRSTLQDPVILEIAKAHGKTAAQVMLCWHLQQGRSVIPKSVTPSRIAENLAVFDFSLTTLQLAAIDALETGVRGGPEPETVTLQNFHRDIPDA